MFIQVKEKITAIKKYYQKKSIQNMISLSFTFISIVGMILVVLPLYFRFIRTAEHLIERKNMQAVEQTNQYLDSYLRNIMKVSDTVYYQIIKNADLAEDSIVGDMDLLYNANREQLVSIALFNRHGEVEAAVPLSNLKTTVNTKGAGWFKETTHQTENIHFSTPHVQNLFNDPDYRYRWVVSISRSVELTNNKETERGVLLVDMNFSGIEQVCRSASLGSSGYVYLMDSNGEIIYHPRQQLLYSKLEYESNKSIVHFEDGNHREIFNRQKRLITVKTVGYTGWKLVAVTPSSEIKAQFSSIEIFVVIIFLFGLIVLILVNSIVSARIANPIKKLEKSVQKLENGDLNIEISVGGSYEINHLGQTISTMVAQMKILMDDIVVEQELKRKSELDALQTQINPHFLYNTLDSAIWMIENERYDGAITMVTSLARLFRISISKGKSIITVKDELEHAKHYLTIQNIRYKNKFDYEIIAENEVMNLATMKLIIQPMIENAIYYGLEYMTEGDGGKIEVRAYIKEDDLYIDVVDNGIGMVPNVVEGLLDSRRETKSKGSGIGMRNVHERIRLCFGTNYGVEIMSEPDEGTTVRMHMPKITIEEIKERERQGVK